MLYWVQILIYSLINEGKTTQNVLRLHIRILIISILSDGIVVPGKKSKSIPSWSNGSVCVQFVQVFSCCQIFVASWCWQVTTCLASSISPHLGQESLSCIFCHFINLPTPYMPELCLMINSHLVFGTSLTAMFKASKWTAGDIFWGSLPFSSNYVRTLVEWTIS